MMKDGTKRRLYRFWKEWGLTKEDAYDVLSLLGIMFSLTALYFLGVCLL